MMTREEARIELQDMKDTFEEYEPGGSRGQMALKVALSALRPVSREKVERMRGEWIVQQDEHKEYIKRCSKCGFPISGWWGADKFCANCGAPMTDEAVEMVMEKLKKVIE